LRRRALIYAVLALTIPLPALAVPGRGGPAPLPQQSLSVAVALDSCGTAADSIVCKIDASWNQIAGADRYTASVTRADGSVVDFGDVGAGSASFWVPYVGNGTYSVSVSAYGTPPGENKPEVIARDRSASPESEQETPGAPGPDAVGGPISSEEAVDPGTDPGAEPEEPACEEPESEPEPVEPPPAEAGDPAADESAEALPEETAEALDETAEVPESIDCPAAEPAPGPATG
jgi:hypothetical protein